MKYFPPTKAHQEASCRVGFLLITNNMRHLKAAILFLPAGQILCCAFSLYSTLPFALRYLAFSLHLSHHLNRSLRDHLHSVFTRVDPWQLQITWGVRAQHSEPSLPPQTCYVKLIEIRGTATSEESTQTIISDYFSASSLKQLTNF